MRSLSLRLALGVFALVALSIAPSLAQKTEPGKTILLDAEDLASVTQRADKPAPGKWWLKRDAKDWGATKGNILMTGMPNDKPIPKDKLEEWQVIPADYYVPYRLPALEIDPKAKGWYRIHVGMYHEALPVRARLLAHLSGEPFPEYLQTPDRTTAKTAEIYWKAADLTGKRIHIAQPPAPMQHPDHGWIGGLTHIRLVPMSEKEVADARHETTLPPVSQRLFGMLDSTDEIFWWGTIEREDDVRAIIYRHQQAGFGRVYWRAWGSHLDTSVEIPEAAPRWTLADELRWCTKQRCKVGWMPYLTLPHRFDPLKVAVAYGKENDVEVHAWVRLTNLNREPYAEFWHQHPEFRLQTVSKDPKTGEIKRGTYPRVLSFAYPQVRALYVKVCKQLASTGTRGIMLDLLRHPPIAGYEPIVADAFKKKHGIDMESLATGKGGVDALISDPKINEHLSGYLEEFLKELRKELGNDIEISVRCSGPDKYAMRGADWIKSGLINTIVDGNWYSGNGPRPTIDATVSAAGTKGKAYAIAEDWDVDPNKSWQRRPGLLSPEAILALSKHYRDKGVHRFGIYESTEFTWHPELRRAMREAGWSYTAKPGK
ncbi:MAG: hypothetical protein K2R98_30995 [Gemmataceae bacterium]|nr:hypothetical protein [Gemmataceae bacterium]